MILTCQRRHVWPSKNAPITWPIFRCFCLSAVHPMPSAADLEKAFKVFDTDNSGTLSASELIKILTRPGGAALTMADAEELIQRADVNGGAVGLGGILHVDVGWWGY